MSEAGEYTSDNTERLSVGGMVEILLKLDVVQNALRSSLVAE
jgi:hypothetical protein